MSAAQSKIFTGKDSLQHLSKFFSAKAYSQVFVLVDENTLKHCYPKIKKLLPKHSVIQIKSGEKNKTLATCEIVWKKLTDENADRKTLLINLGGGVIGDLGGFAAGCYKRGIKFINIPTTLLAMVDASVGAKTGIDFKGFKNQIGLFNEPEAVFIHTEFLKTLPERELKAGLAEVIKHYLIADQKEFVRFGNLFSPWRRKKKITLHELNWDLLIKKNVAIKSKIVANDKFETGMRKALNFGHTIGHAIETYFLNRGIKILHGEAVAAGIVCESHISLQKKLITEDDFNTIGGLTNCFIRPLPKVNGRAIPKILRLIKQDKKNLKSKNQFTLLKGIGNYTIDNNVDEAVIAKALYDHYNTTFYNF